MVIKPDDGKSALKSDTAAPSKGNGHTAPSEQIRDFSRIERLIADLDRRVAQNRRDLDVQFQRLADLQAVIDRMQIAAKHGTSRSRRRGQGSE